MVVSLLRQCYNRPICKASRLNAHGNRAISQQHQNFPQARNQAKVLAHVREQAVEGGLRSIERRCFHSTSIGAQNAGQSDRNAERIAVLGGGITGLSTAYHLSREFPRSQITLYEGSERLGGWLRSTPVEVDNGTVVFESGPRTLRWTTPASLTTLEIISQLGLEEELILTPLSSPAAQNRYVYYPDHLVRMPGPGQDLATNLWTILTEPLFQGALPGIGLEYFREPRAEDVEDESIAAFFIRRTGGSEVPENIVSAVLHGIYGGDVYQLSARSLLKKIWWHEGKFGGLVAGMISTLRDRVNWIPESDWQLVQKVSKALPQSLSQSLQSTSVYTFKKGMGQLATSIETHLRSKPNVHFKLGEKVEKVEYDAQNDNVKISTPNGQPTETYSTVISTLSAKNTSALVADSLPSLSSQHSVTVMTVNLYFQDPHLLTEKGFGYLIPRSIPYEQNPECALGVVFDTDSSIGQDTASGTKLTVMMGGHWWDHLAATHSYPTEEEGLSMAVAVLKRHLGIQAEPEAWKVGLHRECIPQYTVGHDQRMKTASRELEKAFKGKLRVAGSSYTGVGLNDCVRSARDVVMGLKDGDSAFGPVKTGLEAFTEPEKWVPEVYGNSAVPR